MSNSHEHLEEGITLGGQVQRLWRDMYLSNGKPGMMTRMYTVEESVKNIVDGQRWIIRLLIGGLILAVLNLVIRK